MHFTIETMRRQDWTQVRTIYGEGLATGIAAFMKTPPKWPAWHADHLPFGRYVARDTDGAVLGWSALAPVPDT